MIIARTPVRISFFGGGTDLPEFFLEEGGAVLGTAINKYIYHSLSHFPSYLFDHKIRFAYRKVECVTTLEDLDHKPFREILRECGVYKDIEVNLASDLPAFSGLGSSSSFTVGLIKGLMAFCGKHISQYDLANRAIYIERDVLRESVGIQDQVFAAYGGLNLITFSSNSSFSVERVRLAGDRLSELNTSLVLVFTGETRSAQSVERRKIENIESIKTNLREILRHVERAHNILTSSICLSHFGLLLHETWVQKRMLDPSVSNPRIDFLYKLGIEAGALGGKLLGAGGGGFMLFYVPPDRQQRFRAALHAYSEVYFEIDAPGSSIIHC
jgi:D-glycero-alpha-D-manno-heptose-7-phosphate kinase